MPNSLKKGVFLLLAVAALLVPRPLDAAEAVKFATTVSVDSATGWHIVKLTAEHPDNPRNTIVATITPEGGSNLYALSVGGNDLIAPTNNISRLTASYGGIPVLFPTPNRVRDANYLFQGTTYRMGFPGERSSHQLHGLVWDDTAWTFDQPKTTKDSAILVTHYSFTETNPRFPAFPFKSTLSVTFTVMSDRVKIAYKVENQDKKALGFGFGLHPFWKVIGTPDQCRIQVDVPWHMEAISLLPTGKLEATAGSKWSLAEPTAVSAVNLDDVFFGATPKSRVRVLFDSIGLEMTQQATADFTHIVVYTPARRPSFCVENQTCSTDAHNLYAKGLVKESNLQVVEPGKSANGEVSYIFQWLK